MLKQLGDTPQRLKEKAAAGALCERLRERGGVWAIGKKGVELASSPQVVTTAGAVSAVVAAAAATTERPWAAGQSRARKLHKGTGIKTGIG